MNKQRVSKGHVTGHMSGHMMGHLMDHMLGHMSGHMLGHVMEKRKMVRKVQDRNMTPFLRTLLPRDARMVWNLQGTAIGQHLQVGDRWDHLRRRLNE